MIECDQFNFNISHAGDYCVLAAQSDTKKLGVDIMKIEYSGGMNKLDDFFRIMNRQFSPSEWDMINGSMTDQSRLARFIRLWTLKESYVKAEGSGIVFPLSKISFTCCSELTSPSQGIVSDTMLYIENKCLHQWQFEESLIDNRHYVCIGKLPQQCDSQSGETSPFKMLSIHDLLCDHSISEKELFAHHDEQYWTDFCKKT